MHIKNKKGQSTVEYVLLVTAVLAVIIAFVTGNNSVFKNQLNSTLNTATGDMSTIAGTLSTSHQAGNATATNTTPPYTVSVLPNGTN